MEEGRREGGREGGREGVREEEWRGGRVEMGLLCRLWELVAFLMPPMLGLLPLPT